jgi:hypothetical protein
MACESKHEAFMEALHEDAMYQMPESVLVDIQSAVEEDIGRLLRAVGDLDPRFKHTTLIKVGSFYEGTKLNRPDEFDCMVEIGDLSNPELVQMASLCPENHGFVHVRLLQDQTPSWGDILTRTPSGELWIRPHSFRERFNQLVYTAALNMSGHGTDGLLVEKPSGTLSFNNELGGTGPNTEVALVWCSKDESVSFRISVDLTAVSVVQIR